MFAVGGSRDLAPFKLATLPESGKGRVANDTPRRLFAHFCNKRQDEFRSGARVKTYTPRAITNQCAYTITRPGPRT